MVRLGREVPELPVQVLFSDIKLRVLATFAPRQVQHEMRGTDSARLAVGRSEITVTGKPAVREGLHGRIAV